ncbi:acyltransferase domain-containing protein [Streptomyces clavuligerus]|uniref:acyltransferase domain-containing protein n=1 Tax=Streptomyces clavuligerus TaxID=1901 RepID=UPI001E289449|nr:acyltransferase domain-containing protein [Streptomyces clavuligerus]
MGAGLRACFPVFADAFDEVCAELDPFLNRPLSEIVDAAAGTDDAALLDTTEYTQPALFAVGVALHRLVGSLGVRPDLVTATRRPDRRRARRRSAVAADAAALVAARGRLMQSAPGGGAMVALTVSETSCCPTWRAEHEVALAAVNGPTATVLSDGKAVEEIAAHWRARAAGPNGSRSATPSTRRTWTPYWTTSAPSPNRSPTTSRASPSSPT